MAKQSGIGQLLVVGGYDLSGDTGQINSAHGGPAALDVTGLDKGAPERIGGVMDGSIEWTSWFNPTAAQAHPVLSALPTSDVGVIYASGTSIGSPAAGLIGKQINYDSTRAQDGGLSFGVSVLSNGYGIEWADLLTAGKRTDTAATNGASLDGAVATTTGWSAYLEVIAFTGTDVTVSVQDSADNSSWATVGSFTQTTTARTAERIAGASGATLRRYTRAITSTTGGVTSATFVVAVCRHPSGASA